MAQEAFIWADEAATVRIAWNGRDTYTAYDIATDREVATFVDDTAETVPDARFTAMWWWTHREGAAR